MLIVLLVGVFVVKDPDGSARSVHSIWHGIVHVADQFVEFFPQVAS